MNNTQENHKIEVLIVFIENLIKVNQTFIDLTPKMLKNQRQIDEVISQYEQANDNLLQVISFIKEIEDEDNVDSKITMKSIIDGANKTIELAKESANLLNKLRKN